MATDPFKSISGERIEMPRSSPSMVLIPVRLQKGAEWATSASPCGSKRPRVRAHDQDVATRLAGRRTSSE